MVYKSNLKSCKQWHGWCESVRFAQVLQALCHLSRRLLEAQQSAGKQGCEQGWGTGRPRCNVLLSKVDLCETRDDKNVLFHSCHTAWTAVSWSCAAFQLVQHHISLTAEKWVKVRQWEQRTGSTSTYDESENKWKHHVFRCLIRRKSTLSCKNIEII